MVSPLKEINNSLLIVWKCVVNIAKKVEQRVWTLSYNVR